MYGLFLCIFLLSLWQAIKPTYLLSSEKVNVEILLHLSRQQSTLR